jgi:hypothetical protein
VTVIDSQSHLIETRAHPLFPIGDARWHATGRPARQGRKKLLAGSL